MTDIDVIDPENAAEMAQLIDQDRTTTRAMGEPLSDVPDLLVHAQILDLACGSVGILCGQSLPLACFNASLRQHSRYRLASGTQSPKGDGLATRG